MGLKCDLCEYVCDFKSNLKRHYLGVHGAIPASISAAGNGKKECSGCRKEVSAANFARHVSTCKRMSGAASPACCQRQPARVPTTPVARVGGEGAAAVGSPMGHLARRARQLSLSDSSDSENGEPIRPQQAGLVDLPNGSEEDVFESFKTFCRSLSGGETSEKTIQTYIYKLRSFANFSRGLNAGFSLVRVAKVATADQGSHQSVPEVADWLDSLVGNEVKHQRGKCLHQACGLPPELDEAEP